MVLPKKFNVAFKVISALIAGIFLFEQIAWAGAASQEQSNPHYYKPLLLADINLDGVVSDVDVDFLSAYYGMTGKSYLEGDMDGDGAVYDTEVDILSANYGQNQRAAGADTSFCDTMGNLVVTIYPDGHREIHISINGLFTKEQLLNSFILQDGDIIIDDTA
ncbi:MAG: hypothetical protein Q8R38_07045, partial [Candidatus Omnitrophota bacterium]|nr:hypothetical protein [Candidatus Omnitrophota bacterium]